VPNGPRPDRPSPSISEPEIAAIEIAPIAKPTARGVAQRGSRPPILGPAIGGLVLRVITSQSARFGQIRRLGQGFRPESTNRTA
jgi:hypothetical protein